MEAPAGEAIRLVHGAPARPARFDAARYQWILQREVVSPPRRIAGAEAPGASVSMGGDDDLMSQAKR
jgi:hypothetical protein